MPEATEAVSEYTRRVELNIRDFLGWVRFIRADDSPPDPTPEPKADEPTNPEPPKVTHAVVVGDYTVLHDGPVGPCLMSMCCLDRSVDQLAELTDRVGPYEAAQALWGEL